MNVLLKQATILDPNSNHHGKKRDVLIVDGKINKIAAKITSAKNGEEITLKDLHISEGWFDSSVSFGEPGFEERENVENGLKTAALSGFAHVAVNSNCRPYSDTKGAIKYLKSLAENSSVALYPIASLTVGSKSEVLAEMFDMNNEGAVSFYDYKKPIANANLLKIALQYAQGFNGLTQSFPSDNSIAPTGIVNENINSTRLGLKGIPPLAEELQITRDLSILEYTGGRLHIPTISTKNSVKLIKEAKKKGLNVTCSVSISNLCLTDAVLEGFDSNYKLMPPLRTSSDLKALLKGLQEGIIDGVTSDHDPIDIEHKKIEFENATFGNIGLESCFGALNSVIGTEKAINSLLNLKSTFNIPSLGITEGIEANLTLFNPNIEWIFSKEDILSTSKNSAFLGQKMKGKAYGIYAKNKLQISK